MTVFILGGSKSGKSDFAQQVALKLARGGIHYYVATLMNTGCAADRAIIASHLDRRAGMGFQTLECGRNILSCLGRADKNGTFLLDSVTTLLSNELFPADKAYALDEAAALSCADDLMTFTRAVSNAVIVSDDLFRDAVRFSPGTDTFRRHLGAIHRRLARECDVVLEMAFDNMILHKGDRQ